MAVPSEVKRVQTAIENRNIKELQWSLWYCRMRQTVPSARPADVKYWRGVEEQVQETLEPESPVKQYVAKKKRGERGVGFGSPQERESKES